MKLCTAAAVALIIFAVRKYLKKRWRDLSMASKYKIKPASPKGIKTYSLKKALAEGKLVRKVSIKDFAKPMKIEDL